MDLQPEQLLAEHCVLRTHDVEHFHAHITGMDGAHKRRVLVSDVGPCEVDIELRQFSLGRIEVGLLYSSVAMAVETERPDLAPFLVQFPLSGAAEIEVNGRDFAAKPGAGFVISPSQKVRRRGESGWTLALSVSGDLLRARLKKRTGRALNSRLEFHPLISDRLPEIRNYCLLIVEAIDRGQVELGSPLADVLEVGLADLLLDLQHHTLGEVLASLETPNYSDRIRAVKDFIDRHLHHKFTVERLAKVADCSVRSLQTTFLELCGMSPMEFVRFRRLAAARALLEAGTGDSKVSDIAHRAGFSQLARFAASYREAYGESPSDTLRRACGRQVKKG